MQGQKASLEETSASQQAELTAYSQRVASLESSLQSATAMEEELRQLLKESMTHVDSLAVEVKGLKSELSGAQEQLACSSGDATRLGGLLASARAELEATKASLAEVGNGAGCRDDGEGGQAGCKYKLEGWAELYKGQAGGRGWCARFVWGWIQAGLVCRLEG